MVCCLITFERIKVMEKIFEVPMGKGIAKPLSVEWGKLSADVQEKVIAYGLKQILNDAHSSVTPATSANVAGDALAYAEKKLAALYAGDFSIRTRASGGAWKGLLAGLLAGAKQFKAMKKAQVVAWLGENFTSAEEFFTAVGEKNPESAAALRKRYDELLKPQVLALGDLGLDF
jgi:hypothetical protein